MLLRTPVGNLFPLALLTIIGGTLSIGFISSRKKEQEERKKREAEHRERINRNTWKSEKVEKDSEGV